MRKHLLFLVLLCFWSWSTIAQITANAGDDKTICAKDNIVLTATGGPNYLWSTGDDTSSIDVKPIETTTYYVTVTDGIETATDEVVVTVNALPTAEIAIIGNRSICDGDSAILSFEFTGNGLWSFLGSSGEGDSTIFNDISNVYTEMSVFPEITTTYTLVSLTDKITGCTNQNMNLSVVVTVNKTIADAGPDLTICMGDEVTLKANDDCEYYQWSTNGEKQTITVSPIEKTTYYVTVSKLGCSGETQVIVNVNEVPLANAGDDETICQGEEVTITANEGEANMGVSFIWSEGSSAKSITVTPIETTTYIVTATKEECYSTDEVVITVNELPKAELIAIGNSTVCKGDSATLQLILTGSGLWSYVSQTGDYSGTTDNVTDNITIYSYIPDSTTSHTILYLTDLTTGCSDSINKTITVTVNELPTANISIDKNEICKGDDVNMEIAFTGNGLWSFSGIATGDAESSFFENINISLISSVENPDVNTTYTILFVKDEITGCSDSVNQSVTVTVNELPTVVAEITGSSTICKGDSAILSFDFTGSGLWSFLGTSGEGDSTVFDDIDNASIEMGVFPKTTTTYTLISLTDKTTGCTNEVNQNLIVTVNVVLADAGADVTICDGDVVNLQTTGGSEYLWSTNATKSSIIVNPTETTTYYVTVSKFDGCTATDDVVVTVNELPIAKAGDDKTICKGNAITLIANEGEENVEVNYKWSEGSSAKSIIVNPIETTTYIVTAIKEGCYTTDDIVVTVNELPLANAGANVTICEAGTAMLVATGGEQYAWSTLEITDTINVTPLTTSTYMVTVTDINNCSNTAQVVVTISNPIANAGNDIIICEGELVPLVANGGEGYEWSTNETTNKIFVAPTENTTYNLTITDKFGCTDTDDIVVTTSASPVANAGLDKTICNGENVILLGMGGTTYAWSNDSTTNIITVNPTETTTYTLTVTCGSDTDTDNIIITVNPLPTADIAITSNSTICKDDNIELTLTFSGNNSWSFVGMNTEDNEMAEMNMDTNVVVFQHTPSANTTYTLFYVKDNVTGCADSVNKSAVAIVNELPEANAGADVTICKGHDILLVATGGSDYVWNTDAETNSTNVEPEVTTTYYVTVTEETTGCTATDDVIVTVIEEINIDISENICIFKGNQTLLTVEGNDDLSYVWNTEEKTSTIEVSPEVTTTYTVTAGYNENCFITSEVTVNVSEMEIDEIVIKHLTCNGSADGSAQVIMTDANDYTFEWTTGAQTAKIEELIGGIYLVIVTDINGCYIIDSVTIIEPNYLEEISNLSYTDLTDRSISLTWDVNPEVTSYIVKLRIVDTDNWTEYKVTEENVLSIIHLLPSTNYEVAIQQVKDENTYSCITTYNFTTGEPVVGPCDITTGLFTDNISSFTAKLNWTNDTNATSYLVRWRVKKGSGEWKYYNAKVGQTSVIVGDLTPATEYEWQIRTICANNYSIANAFSELSTFTTIFGCADITGMDNYVISTYASLRWTPVAGANHYLLRWREVGGEWKYININKQTDNQNIGCISCDEKDKLKEKTPYEWQIRAFCNAEGTSYSNFSAIKQFNTFTTSIENADIITNEFNIYPNPFSETFTVEYNIPQTGNVTIEIFDIKGQKLNTITNQNKSQGKHSLSYSLNNNDNNIYFVRFIFNDQVITKKIVKIQ